MAKIKSQDKSTCPLNTDEVTRFAAEWTRITDKLRKMYGKRKLASMKLVPHHEEKRKHE